MIQGGHPEGRRAVRRRLHEVREAEAGGVHDLLRVDGVRELLQDQRLDVRVEVLVGCAAPFGVGPPPSHYCRPSASLI